jgi:hypothetical protein
MDTSRFLIISLAIKTVSISADFVSFTVTHVSLSNFVYTARAIRPAITVTDIAWGF